MDKLILAKAILAVILQDSPAELAGTYETWPENRETAEEKRARFEALAADTAEVALEEKDPVWAAALATAIRKHEGGLTRHVDLGLGPKAFGDGGRSVCGMQINVGSGETAEGWKREDLVADRKKCIRAGMNKLKRSMGHCKDLGPDAQLSVYAGGRCSPAAYAASKIRMRTAREFLRKMKQVTDTKREEGS